MLSASKLSISKLTLVLSPNLISVFSAFTVLILGSNADTLNLVSDIFTPFDLSSSLLIPM